MWAKVGETPSLFCAFDRHDECLARTCTCSCHDEPGGFRNPWTPAPVSDPADSDPNNRRTSMSNFIREHRKATVIGSALGLIIAGGIAWAIYLLSLGINGTIGGTGAAAWQFSTAAGTTSAGVCTGGTGSLALTPTLATLSMDGQFPGDNCRFQPNVQAKSAPANNTDLKLTVVKVNSLPAGWTLQQETACGTVIPKSGVIGQPGADTPIRFTLTSDAQPSTGAVDITIQAVPASQFDKAMCPAGVPAL